MKKIAFLHTAQVHVQTFDQLMSGQNVELEHLVMPELLARAQKNGLDDVRVETLAALKSLSNADAVVCTCSTLGPIADEFSQIHPHILRIDRPLMQTALTFAPNIAVAICLESTKNATLALLQKCADEAGMKITSQLILCNSAWAYFEAGDQDGFAKAIAQQIKAEITNTASCIILAQASMRVAEPLLKNLSIPVLSSPQLAVDAALKITNTNKPKF